MAVNAATVRPAGRRVTISAELRSFVVIGLLCTAAYALLYTAFRHLGVGALAANAMALTTTMGANFAANRRFSFKASDGPLAGQFASYVVAYLIGLGASSVVLSGLLSALGHPAGAADTAAALAAGLVATAVRYVLMRNWVFRRVSALEGAVPAPAPARVDPLGRAGSAVRSLRMPRPELIALLVLAAVLDLWALGQNGWANDYYSAAVRSMSSSWHNFLYGSFDPSGAHDRRQAAARALGSGALGAAVRLPPAQRPRAAGADGRGERGARLRPHPAPLRPGRGLRGRPRARHHAHGRGDLSPQQPGRPARALLGGRALVPGARARGRAHTLAGALGRVDRAGLRDEDGRGADGAAGHRGRLAVGRAARPPRGGQAAARGRRRHGGRGLRLAAARHAHARRGPSLDLGHERQQRLVADLRLQRPRPARRAGRRSRGPRQRRALRRLGRSAAAASTAPSAGRPAGCLASRSSARSV